MVYIFTNPEIADFTVGNRKSIMNNLKSYCGIVKEGEFCQISSEELKLSMDHSDLFLLDQRKKEDYEESHIENSLHWDWTQLDLLIEKEILPKKSRIIVICYVGASSAQTTGILRLFGYKAFTLEDGIKDWKEKNYPTVSGGGSRSSSSFKKR